jgi:DNA (cytosine-5)-methyltransferase 1
MRYLSVCSGIEAATTAWHELGWEPVAFSEIEPFPSAVLKHHYPDVPNLGDMTKFKEWDIGTIDLLVGGTPCQSFSVAGLRKGLEDPRGNLALTYVGILDKFRPKWFIWENVPGVLSSGSGRDFGSFLGALGQIGYGFAYRVLDAQYFGVAQRRRRVFVVGCLGDWRSAAEVLFEPESLRGDPAPSREKGQKVAPAVSTGAPFSRTGNERVECDAIIPVYGGADPECADTVTSKWAKGSGGPAGNECGLFVAYPIALAENTIGRQPQNGGNGDGFTVGGPMYTLNATGVHGVAQPMAFNIAPGKGALKDDIHITEANTTKTLDASGSNPAMHQGGAAIIQQMAQPIAFTTEQTPKFNENQALTLTKSEAKHNQSVLTEMAVRRLTPVECERLQGFPDGYTNIPWRKQMESPDGPRYKSLGNSMAVPVMAWIGKRIANAP